MMGTAVKARREAIQHNIALNPAAIVVTRTELVRSGGGYEESETQLPSQTVRIYQRGGGGNQDVESGAGTKQTDARWGLLGDDTLDLQAGSDVTDRFTHNGHPFEVIDVIPQTVEGEVVGYQADLREVS